MLEYDVLIVGGGPAGLTAAMHLAWHDRRVVVLDRRTGPLFFTIESLYNVPGMPTVRGVDLQRNLAKQATDLGAEIARTNIVRATREADLFLLESETGETWQGRTLLLATGVARYHPTVDGDYKPCFKYAGKGNLYYCPDCEAPLIGGKSTVVIGVGKADSAAAMAVGLTRYTDAMTLLLTADRNLSERAAASLDKRGIEIVSGEIKELDGAKGELRAVVLDGGRRVEAEAYFVSSPAIGRTDLAEQLGVEMAATGHHAMPKSQRGDTNIPGVWVAGDLRPMTQQVSVAMGTGNIAAVMIDQFLRKKDIRSPRDERNEDS